jgi:hypothetical protein
VFNAARTGFTIHCVSGRDFDSVHNIESHCRKRKYMHKAETWFGIIIDAKHGTPGVGLQLQYPWVYDENLEKLTASASSPGISGRVDKAQSRKVGRNDVCPCGSGKKFKRCCRL